MKKLLIPLLILPLIFISCSSDEDTPTIEELIVGTWTFNKSATEIKINDAEAGKLIDEEFKTFDAEQKGEVYIFAEDGTYKKYDNIAYPEELYDEGNYKIEKGILYLTGNGYFDYVYTIEIEGNNTLKLAMDWTESVQKHPDIYGLEDYENIENVVIEEVISIEIYARK